MMIMRMSYNDLRKGGAEARLHVYGVGTFPVFSGKKPRVNDVNCTHIPSAAIPVGRYWIVDRPEGTFSNQVRAKLIDWKTGGNHAEWFGLFSDTTRSDSIFVEGVSRGSFRLHPLRPDGTGESEGCITFCNREDFYIVRRSLTRMGLSKALGSNLPFMTYGFVDVQGVSNFAKCKMR